MPAKDTRDGKRGSPLLFTLVSGGGGGMMEALMCHPLDTIKVRMQLRRRSIKGGTKIGMLKTGLLIAQKETPLALYKGLGAVLTGIIPKMAIRFTAFEKYKAPWADPRTGEVSAKVSFLAGAAAGVTEAVLVVTPMEVVKIRLQGQTHSLSDPLDRVKYRSAPQALVTIFREEGFGALYRGLSLTALRQGTNQASNFLVFRELQKVLRERQPQYKERTLPFYQTALCGCLSGAVGPFVNAPADTIKTKLQKTAAEPGQSAFQRIYMTTTTMIKQEGVRSLYKGITPRIARVALGQGVTFPVVDFIRSRMQNSSSWFSKPTIDKKEGAKQA